MKHIDKKAEPICLSDWKKQDKMYQRGHPNWKRLNADVRKCIQEALLNEQGFVCCYCGSAIQMDNSHIEHFRPKNKYPELQLEYDNLLCSCQKELQKTEPRHCGNSKGSWFDENLIISPLNPECEFHFNFLENGDISPSEESNVAAQQTIKHLALKIKKLKELRKASISAVLDNMDVIDNFTLQKEIQIYSQRDINNKYSPFCFVILNVLSSLLN